MFGLKVILVGFARGHKKAFYLVATTFIFISSIFVFVFEFVKLSPKNYSIQRQKDDVLIMNEAYNICIRGGGLRVADKTIVEIEGFPPKTKTKIKRKFILDEDCKIHAIIY